MWEIETLSQYVTIEDVKEILNPDTRLELFQVESTMYPNNLAAVQTVNLFNKIIGGPTYCMKCNRPFNTNRARAAHQYRCKGNPIHREFFSQDLVKKIPVAKLVFSNKLLEEILENKLKRLQTEWNCAFNWYAVENPSWP